jgi:hypothetical protein
MHFFKIILFVFCSFSAVSQTLEKAPKMKSIETGVRYLRSKTGFPTGELETFAPFLQYNFGWQLTGFSKGHRAYISIPLGLTYSKQAKVLYYGFRLQHDLKREGKTIPYWAYNLQLNQLIVANATNRRIGHETGADLGIRKKLNEKRFYTLALNYGMPSFPNFNEKTGKLRTLALKIGFGL